MNKTMDNLRTSGIKCIQFKVSAGNPLAKDSLNEPYKLFAMEKH